MAILAPGGVPVSVTKQSGLPLLRVVSGAAAPGSRACPSALLAEAEDPTPLLLSGERVPPLHKEDIIYGLLAVVLARRQIQQKLGRMRA